ncbi:PDZ domain-containing protein [Leptolyngbya sp. NK1-12]|uniref:PDZ domain-containing protein n=1 Tax=Leptolyngbya sp. NK1-12 TaxID=2547451 RepID=A0AA96WQ66_9CYAN|nr:PDZ domain-containing protein [Leptolyngbya sp. NK1-12]
MKILDRKISRLSVASGILAVLITIGLHLYSGSLSSANQASGFNAVTLFEQVWQTVNEHFYDPEFNGVNWSALREQYQPQVQQVNTREAAAAIINTMLAELNTSHTRLYIPEEPAYYQLLGIFQPRSSDLQDQLQPFFPDGKITYPGIGIFTRTLDGETFVSGVLEGSPAAAAGLQVGDRIVSVAGRPFHPIQSFDHGINRVEMVIQRTASQDSLQTLTVAPKQFEATTMFLDAQIASTEVIEQQNRRIGYMHLWSYAGDQYQQQLEDELLYGRLKDVDAFVLDLRGGWGGASPTVLNFFTGRGPSITNIVPRQNLRATTPSHWNKPVVMLVNQESRSAKEILAYAFQQYKIGPVVGSRTAGAVVAGRPFLMPDGSALYVAVADVLLDGTQRLEGRGVVPDIPVSAVLPYAAGADPQREQAIKTALQASQ